MFKKIITKIKNLFVLPSQHENPTALNKYVDERSGKVIETAVQKLNGKRMLTLDDNTCALIIHPNYVFEAVLTKYNSNSTEFTEEEILLMSLVVHLKQEGFADMLVSELHRIAMKNDKLFK